MAERLLGGGARALSRKPGLPQPKCDSDKTMINPAYRWSKALRPHQVILSRRFDFRVHFYTIFSRFWGGQGAGAGARMARIGWGPDRVGSGLGPGLGSGPGLGPGEAGPRIFCGYFPDIDIFRIFSGYSPDILRTSSGYFPDILRRFSGYFPGIYFVLEFWT